MKKIFKNQIALALAGILAGTSAVAGTLVINGDTSDPAPKAAFQAVIDGFEAEIARAEAPEARVNER